MQKSYISEKELFEKDPYLPEVLMFVVYYQQASTPAIQRRFGLGYPRAARMIDILKEYGFISGEAPRKVNISKDEFLRNYHYSEKTLKCIVESDHTEKIVNIKQDVKNLNLEKIAIFNEKNEKISENKQKTIKKLIKSLFDYRLMISLDVEDARAFLEKKDYKLRYKSAMVITTEDIEKLSNELGNESALLILEVPEYSTPGVLMLSPFFNKEILFTLRYDEALKGNEMRINLLY